MREGGGKDEAGEVVTAKEEEEEEGVRKRRSKGPNPSWWTHKGPADWPLGNVRWACAMRA